jgi:hypothetical protein
MDRCLSITVSHIGCWAIAAKEGVFPHVRPSAAVGLYPWPHSLGN